MGIHVIKMPDIGEGIAEVELVGWHVKEGDIVAEDQLLADVMTDKATVEIPSPVAGTVQKLGGEVGKTMAVGSELIRIEVAGEGNVRDSIGAAAALSPTPKSSAGGTPIVDVTNPAGAVAMPPLEKIASAAIGASLPPVAESMSGIGSARAEPARVQPQTPTSATARIAAGAGFSRAPTGDGFSRAPTDDGFSRAAGDRPIASPAVRRQAWDLGIELQFVPGTGPAGRIMHEDIDGYALRTQSSMSSTASSRGHSRYVERNDEEIIPVIGLRRRIAQKMQESKRRIPHFTYVEEIDVTEVEALRAKLNAQHAKERGKLTMLPFIARAMIVALRDFPQINATYDDQEGGGNVTRHGAVHLGVAAQTEAGLMVPVVRHAEAKDLWEIGAEVARLADAARAGKAARDELSGSTITLTSLGALGGIVSTPVINHPEVAIVGVNRIVERPMIKGGAVVARLTMNLSSSFDHRVVDGMDAAEFIQAVRALLESPALLFVD